MNNGGEAFSMKEEKNKTRHLGINIGIMVLSLVIAFGLWAYVMVVNNPDKVTEIANIPITFTGEDALFRNKTLMMTSDRNRTVTLSFRGSMSDLFRLTSESVKVVVDLSALTTAGEFAVNYTVVYPLGLQNGQVTEATMGNTIPVTVDLLETKPVIPKLTGDITASEGYLRGQVKLEPSVLNITGPSKLLETVSYAEIELPPMDPISTTFTGTLPFKLYDKDGRKISTELITADISAVDVTVPIMKYKQVAVKLVFKDGGGLTEEENITCNYEPKMITVAGDAEVLDKMSFVQLGTIELEDLLEPTTEEYPIVLPGGVELKSGETAVKVEIDIHDVDTKVVEVSPYVTGFENVPGYRLDLITKQISVTLRGSPEALQAFPTMFLYAVIKLDGVVLNPGAAPTEHLVTVTIPDTISNVGVLGSYDAYVALVPIESEEGVP